MDMTLYNGRIAHLILSRNTAERAGDHVLARAAQRRLDVAVEARFLARLDAWLDESRNAYSVRMKDA